MVSDLNKHKETIGHIGIELGTMQMVAGLLKSAHEMRDFIEGFN